VSLSFVRSSAWKMRYTSGDGGSQTNSESGASSPVPAIPVVHPANDLAVLDVDGREDADFGAEQFGRIGKGRRICHKTACVRPSQRQAHAIVHETHRFTAPPVS